MRLAVLLHHQDLVRKASFKATPMTQADLVDRDPAAFQPAAYVGRFGWVDVDLARIEVAELEGLIREAWRLTAPKRLAATLPWQGPGPRPVPARPGGHPRSRDASSR